ncbi:MAG: phenylalanine--tRNA ligase beta subunit-related protein [Blautia sp.]
MKKITIDEDMKKLWKDSVLGCIRCKVKVEESTKELLQEIDDFSKELQDTIQKVPDIPKREQIAVTRRAYRAFGKDPSRYRSSAEAMCRRIVQGKGLYHVNNVVDCGNLFSIKTGYSLGIYDAEKVGEKLIWRVAPEGTCYKGIGKDEINVEFLPVLEDEKGPFGNPTSDSVRTRVTEETREILAVVFGFAETTGGIETEVTELFEMFQKYCYTGDGDLWVVR